VPDTVRLPPTVVFPLILGIVALPAERLPVVVVPLIFALPVETPFAERVPTTVVFPALRLPAIVVPPLTCRRF
jgi:hypothetical protein